MLVAPASAVRLTKTRAFVGAAVIAVTVSIPDISAGAMDGPLMRFELREARSNLPPPVWGPSAGANAPVYSPAMAAEHIAPASITFGSAQRLDLTHRMQPLAFLAKGSERFDLAFAGVTAPSLEAIPVELGLAEQFASDRLGQSAALRRRLIDVPQIGDTLTYVAPPPPDTQAEREPVSNGNNTLARADEAVAAAFAGELDVSGGASEAVRQALPVSSSADISRSLPVETEPAQVIPILAPDPGLSPAAPNKSSWCERPNCPPGLTACSPAVSISSSSTGRLPCVWARWWTCCLSDIHLLSLTRLQDRLRWVPMSPLRSFSQRACRSATILPMTRLSSGSTMTMRRRPPKFRLSKSAYRLWARSGQGIDQIPLTGPLTPA